MVAPLSRTIATSCSSARSMMGYAPTPVWRWQSERARLYQTLRIAMWHRLPLVTSKPWHGVSPRHSPIAAAQGDHIYTVTIGPGKDVHGEVHVYGSLRGMRPRLRTGSTRTQKLSLRRRYAQQAALHCVFQAAVIYQAYMCPPVPARGTRPPSRRTWAGCRWRRQSRR